MDYAWFLFDFVGRINRAKFWLAALTIACWMLFLIALALGSAKLLGGSAINRFGFDINDVFSVLDPSTYFSALGTIRIQTPVDYVIPLSFYAIGTPLFLWVYLATSIKRLHDRNKSAWWMIPFFLVPALSEQFGGRLPDSHAVLTVSLIASALWLWGLVEMGWLKGTAGPNRFGADPLARAEPVAQARVIPRWDRHSELELIPHSASPSPKAGMHVKREHD